MSDEFFAPPAFNPEQALLQFKRNLRDLRPLAERGNSFTLQGQPVIELAADSEHLNVRLAKKPARAPEWELRACRNSADVRALQDEIKRRLVRWTDET